MALVSVRGGLAVSGHQLAIESPRDAMRAAVVLLLSLLASSYALPHVIRGRPRGGFLGVPATTEGLRAAAAAPVEKWCVPISGMCGCRAVVGRGLLCADGGGATPRRFCGASALLCVCVRWRLCESRAVAPSMPWLRGPAGVCDTAVPFPSRPRRRRCSG